MSAVRRNWRLLLVLVGLFGWIDSIPLFGPVGAAWSRAHGVAFGGLPLWFLGAHGICLVLWGHFLDRHPGSSRALARLAVAGAAALTLGLWVGPAGAWPGLFAAMGAVTAAGMVAWGRWYATTVEPGALGRTFALAAASLALITWSTQKLVPHVPPQAALLATIALPAAAWIALARFDPSPAPDRCSPPLPRGRRTAPVVRMGLFIMFFSFVAGLSYQIIVVAPLSPYADDSLRLLPYILGVLVCGALADGRNLKTPLVGGASLLALAFLIGAWTQPIAQYAGLGLNGVAFGLLEATPWLLLAANATPDTAGRWFGWGLNLNIVPIFFGAAASAAIQGLDPPHAGLLAAVALILAVASLHGVEDPLAELHHQAPAPVIHGTSATFDHLLDRRYGDVLSQREAEVGRLAVLGVESSEIARRLYISENTVKTHLRHVYRKTASTGRSDLLRKLVAPGGQRE